MSAWRFILASLRHYRRIHFAVAAGVAVATAVLTGALLVGDSMRGSLRDLTIERLGRIDCAVVGAHPFRAELAKELASEPGFEENFSGAQPAILISGTLQSGSGENVRRATSVAVVGFGPEFWSVGEGGPAVPLGDGDAAITQSLASELGVEVGESILLRVPIAGAIPADSPLGAKQVEKSSRSRRLRVAAVLAPNGFARFGLMPSQQLPRNVFVPLATLQKLLDQPGKVNAILVSSESAEEAAGRASEDGLTGALNPRLDDLGLRLDHLTAPTECLQISSDELVLPDAAVRAVVKACGGQPIQPVVTYLANTISVGQAGSEKKIPYSTIAGVDSVPQLGPALDSAGKPIVMAENEIVLNRWAANDLGAKVGDEVRITYYEPESTHGRAREHQPPAVFKLKAIAELKDSNGRPTPAADPKLTPEMPGVTDQKSISDWDLPFELVEKIRPQDEKYWDDYRTTPKGFISLAAAKRWWTSRWGTISLMRLPASVGSLADVADRVRREIAPAALGMTVLPVKRLGLEAAEGTTPFGGLFLGFSFFLIASAVMLVVLLFQLGVQQRANELGTLAAVGVRRRRIARLLSLEGVLVAISGATVGVVAGVLYAWVVVYGLTTWWVAAISTPFLRIHVTPGSLLIGWFAGTVVSWLAIRSSIWRMLKTSPLRLLGGDVGRLPYATQSSRSRWNRFGVFFRWPAMRIVLFLLAAAICVAGFFLQGESQAGSFFGAGATVLALLLGELSYRMRTHRGKGHHSFSLGRLSALNMARNAGRSTLTIGLVAAASFLILAVSAFRLDTGEGGTGGFEYVATSDQPIHYDLNAEDGRRELGFSDAASQQLSGWRVYSLRVAAGEDASCLNLYQPTQPRVLGAPKSLVERGGFEWSATEKRFGERPWAALEIDLGKDTSGRRIVPAVLDASTAIYSLHLDGLGSQYTIRDGAGRLVTVQVVGLLANSVLQGRLLVSEANFVRMFPEVGGYRYFLIEHAVGTGRAMRDMKANGTRSLPATLESALGEEGFDVVDAHEQLTQYLAVQNTYLSTFQSLGALGLLLGTVGIAVVQLRNVLERRGELALMRAEGFRRHRLTSMVVSENAALLVLGLVVGSAAAVVALIPQWAPHGASVPWGALLALLSTIAVVGVVASWLATRRALTAPIVPALRGD